MSVAPALVGPRLAASGGVSIRRETSAALINTVSNLPGVVGALSYHDEPLDWSPLFSGDTRVIVVSNGDDACAVFAETSPYSWQGHTIFGPTCRGRRAIETGQAMLQHMRSHAALIWGATPVANRAARWFNRQLGGRSVGFDHFDAEGDVEIFFFGSQH